MHSFCKQRTLSNLISNLKWTCYEDEACKLIQKTYYLKQGKIIIVTVLTKIIHNLSKPSNAVQFLTSIGIRYFSWTN